MKLVGERRALAAVIFALYALLYFVLGISGAAPEMARAMFGLAFVYGLAFFALVAGYFWARWYAVGVGLYGVIVAALGMWQVGAEPIILFMGGTHLAAAFMLWGQSMSASYDGQTKWRERFHMDDNAVHRLGRSVIRAGVSLPFVLLYALQPKTGGIELVASLSALALTGLGMRGIIKLRTWGLMAMAAAGVILLALAGNDAVTGESIQVLKPALAGGLLLSAVAPWLRRV